MHLLNHLRFLLKNNYDQVVDVIEEEDVDNGNRSVVTSTEADPVRLVATLDDDDHHRRRHSLIASPSGSGCSSSDEERATTPTKKKKKKQQSGTKTTNKATKKKTVTSKDNTATNNDNNSSSNRRRSSSGSSSNSSKDSFDEEVGLHDNNDSMGSTASNSCSSHGSGHEDGAEDDDHHRCLEHDDLDCYIVHTSGQQPQSIDDEDDDDYEEVEYDNHHMIPPDEPHQQQSSSQQQQQQRITPRSSIQMLLYRRICQELAWDGKMASLFRCIDPITHLPLDIPRTFAPRGIHVLVWKIIAAGMACSTMMMGIMNVAKPTFYLAYLTHWSILFCTVYLVMSLSNSIVTTLFSSSSKGQKGKHKQLPSIKPKDGSIIPNDGDDTTISPPLCWRYGFTWIMFELGAHTASGASLMFWTVLVFNLKKPLTYNIVSNHGIILLVTLIDGMIMNRIPYRLHHWYVFILPIHLLYVVWTLVHDFLLHVGNPDLHDDDPNVNDDCIYQGVLEWKDSWYIALFTSTGLIFVIGPVFLLILWYLSIYPIMSICTCQKRMRFRDRLLYQNRRVRHYVDGDDDSDDDDMMYDDEENSGSTAELSFHSSSASSDDDDDDQI